MRVEASEEQVGEGFLVHLKQCTCLRDHFIKVVFWQVGTRYGDAAEQGELVLGQETALRGQQHLQFKINVRFEVNFKTYRMLCKLAVAKGMIQHLILLVDHLGRGLLKSKTSKLAPATDLPPTYWFQQKANLKWKDCLKQP